MVKNLGKELDYFKKYFLGKVYVDQKVLCCSSMQCLGYSKKKEGFIIKANKLLLYSLSQKNFYGPQVRWMCLSMFLRIGVWRNIWRAYRRGFWGNLRGEGLVLGGVFVIGPGDQVEHK